jgi:hypothetical protein
MLIDKTRGIFLGNYGDVPMWSEKLIFPITKAYSFAYFDDAEEYAKFFKETGDFNISIESVNYDLKHVPIDVLIKEGYSKYTYKMLKFLPLPSERIN